MRPATPAEFTRDVEATILPRTRLSVPVGDDAIQLALHASHAGLTDPGASTTLHAAAVSLTEPPSVPGGWSWRPAHRTERAKETTLTTNSPTSILRSVSLLGTVSTAGAVLPTLTHSVGGLREATVKKL